MQDVVLSPTDFVALVNQTLEFAYPNVAVEGELCNFRVAKNRWIYFSLKDDISTVEFFGSVHALPGPLQDGMKVRVLGNPRLHARFGFSVNVITLAPVGEGSIKKAADLVAAKLAAEGLFEASRKRPLPAVPAHLGLITAAGSAAYHDFIKILGERWGGVEVIFADAYVQGDQAPSSIVKAIEHMNQLPKPPEILVITRGGGSAEDLAAFNDERVVRAVAASRIPTLVAVGHEVDESLTELAADLRASTPSHAAQAVVPDRRHELASLRIRRDGFTKELNELIANLRANQSENKKYLTSQAFQLLEAWGGQLAASRRLATLFDPAAALKRGYAIVKKGDRVISRISQVEPDDVLSLALSDGKLRAVNQGVIKDEH